MTSSVFYIVLFLSLATCSIKGQLSLSITNYKEAVDYENLIQTIRRFVTKSNMYELYGIPVLKKEVHASERFMVVNFVNRDKKAAITIAIDVVSLGLVGYLANNTFYMFPDAPQEAFAIVFPSTTRVVLDFNSDYKAIETAAGTTRLETFLGSGPMDNAISTLFHYHQTAIPAALLVILQMVLEGVKFRFIELSVYSSIRYGHNFKPSLAIVSLEDNWAKISSQIQKSPSLQGLFGEVIKLYDSNDRIIKVDSIYYPIISANIAIQLYYCIVISTNVIRMPIVGLCNVQPRTAHITGRQGFCVDVTSGLLRDGNPIILYTCGHQVNQRFTFQRDGTIRYFGKCLTFNDKHYVVIYNCSKVAPSTITWNVSLDGTISNPKSGLVLTANNAATTTKLTMEANTHTSGQSWRVGNYVDPIVVFILGMDGLCLEVGYNNTYLDLNHCEKILISDQSWALYSDGTIRVNISRNLCVSSSSDCSPGQLVNILGCNRSSNQRWNFMSDGTLLNPKCGMRFDINKDLNMILYPKTGEPTQRWTILY